MLNRFECCMVYHCVWVLRSIFHERRPWSRRVSAGWSMEGGAGRERILPLPGAGKYCRHTRVHAAEIITHVIIWQSTVCNLQ